MFYVCLMFNTKPKHLGDYIDDREKNQNILFIEVIHQGEKAKEAENKGTSKQKIARFH